MGFLSRLRRSAPDPQQILDGELLVLTPHTAGRGVGEFVAQKGDQFEFVMVSDEEGLAVLPAFTSEEALSRWQPDGSPYLALRGRVLIELLAESDWDRIVVDGADPTAFAISRSAARELLGVTAHEIPAGSQALVGQPAVAPPDGLRDALRRACEREPQIASAYVFQIAILEMDEDPHLAVGLELDERVDDAESKDIVRRIGDAVQPASWGYEFLDFHLLKGEMLELVPADSDPVYRR